MAVDATAVARVVGVEVAFQQLNQNAVFRLPQQVALIGQGATASAGYSLDPAQVTSAAEVGQTYGFGSPLHLAALQLLPSNRGGLGTIPLRVYPLDDDGSGVAALGDITPVGTQVGSAEYRVIINGIISAPLVIADGDVPGAPLSDKIVAAIQGNINMPVTAVTNVAATDLTLKWEGVSGNDCNVSVIGPDQGITFTITQPVGGLVNPDVDLQLANIVSIWETLIVNCMELGDSTSLGKYETWGEGRWDVLVKKPAVVITGSGETVLATNTAIGNGRKSDRVNSVAWAVGSPNFPLQIAAAQVAKIAVRANNNPARDYAGQGLTGLVPGADSDQFTYSQKDTSVKSGLSTTEIIDGTVTIQDTVTFYHPDGEEPPAYRKVVDIIKLQNLIFNLDLIFESEGWNGAPLIPDEDPTTNPAARKPSAAISAVNSMLDGAGLDALISDPATAKINTKAVIDSGNNNRLNVSLTVQLSGNVAIISTTLNFGFFFGAA